MQNFEVGFTSLYTEIDMFLEQADLSDIFYRDSIFNALAEYLVFASGRGANHLYMFLVGKSSEEFEKLDSSPLFFIIIPSFFILSSF
jgi:hypothetical protein